MEQKNTNSNNQSNDIVYGPMNALETVKWKISNTPSHQLFMQRRHGFFLSLTKIQLTNTTKNYSSNSNDDPYDWLSKQLEQFKHHKKKPNKNMPPFLDEELFDAQKDKIVEKLKKTKSAENATIFLHSVSNFFWNGNKTDEDLERKTKIRTISTSIKQNAWNPEIQPIISSLFESYRLSYIQTKQKSIEHINILFQQQQILFFTTTADGLRDFVRKIVERKVVSVMDPSLKTPSPRIANSINDTLRLDVFRQLIAKEIHTQLERIASSFNLFQMIQSFVQTEEDLKEIGMKKLLFKRLKCSLNIDIVTKQMQLTKKQKEKIQTLLQLMKKMITSAQSVILEGLDYLPEDGGPDVEYAHESNIEELRRKETSKQSNEQKNKKTNKQQPKQISTTDVEWEPQHSDEDSNDDDNEEEIELDEAVKQKWKIKDLWQKIQQSVSVSSLFSIRYFFDLLKFCNKNIILKSNIIFAEMSTYTFATLFDSNWAFSSNSHVSSWLETRIGRKYINFDSVFWNGISNVGGFQIGPNGEFHIIEISEKHL